MVPLLEAARRGNTAPPHLFIVRIRYHFIFSRATSTSRSPPVLNLVHRLQSCSRSWSASRATADRSRRSHSARSSRESARNRVKYRPRVRTSSNSNSSLSRSIQLRTLRTRRGMGDLLKTSSLSMPQQRTKSKHYFRLCFALKHRPSARSGVSIEAAAGLAA